MVSICKSLHISPVFPALAIAAVSAQPSNGGNLVSGNKSEPDRSLSRYGPEVARHQPPALRGYSARAQTVGTAQSAAVSVTLYAVQDTG